MPKHAQESSLLRAGLELQSERTPVDNRRMAMSSKKGSVLYLIVLSGY